MHKQGLRAPLVAACGLIALLAIAPAAHATNASVPPVKVDGNPKCADYGLTSITKFDPVDSGTKGGVTLTKHDTYYVKWTSTVAVDRVIVKGGPNANIYKYPVDTFGDDWLHAPINDNGKPYGLSHVEFCSDGSSDPQPKPGIRVEKSGPDTAYVGDEATFTYKVTNTGNVKLSEPVVTDDKCAPVTKVTQQTSFDPGDVWTYTCTTTITGSMGDELVNTAKACGMYGDTKKCDTDTHCTDILKPAIALEKTGAGFAYAGDTVTYGFAATNTGNVTLDDVELTDSKCQATLVRKAGETDMTFDEGDVWHYTCTAVVPAGVAKVDNTAEVCGTVVKQDVEPREVCDEDDHSFPVRSIAIELDKEAVETTAVAGSTVNFTIAVKNTGTTSYVGYVFDDPNCDEVRTGANAADATLDPGETWTYACAMATQAGQTVAENTATATGTNGDGKTASATDSASIPLTQPPADNPPTQNPPAQNPPSSNPGGTVTTPSQGGVLPVSVASGRASLRGPSGCVKRAFRARVSGRSIASVTFFVDGKKVKTVSGKRSVYAVKVRPGRLGFGRHKIVARVVFTAASGTAARSIPLTFRRCPQGAVAPRFTG
jgi:hypothetical protein